jgi:hypothetical protein
LKDVKLASLNESCEVPKSEFETEFSIRAFPLRSWATLTGHRLLIVLIIEIVLNKETKVII